jgi:hypothetical protein
MSQYLAVRGDAFQVSHPFPLARFIFGQDYCYRADDTTIEVIPGLQNNPPSSRWGRGRPLCPGVNARDTAADGRGQRQVRVRTN